MGIHSGRHLQAEIQQASKLPTRPINSCLRVLGLVRVGQPQSHLNAFPNPLHERVPRPRAGKRCRHKHGFFPVRSNDAPQLYPYRPVGVPWCQPVRLSASLVNRVEHHATLVSMVRRVQCCENDSCAVHLFIVSSVSPASRTDCFLRRLAHRQSARARAVFAVYRSSSALASSIIVASCTLASYQIEHHVPLISSSATSR